jgi:polyribonucleotide nucleotidyltransferase
MKVVNQETGEDITEQLKAERDAERTQRDQQKAAGE